MADIQQLRLLAKKILTPSAPVTVIDLFTGRGEELDMLRDACTTPGRHGVLFGERGVGKTSLASVFLLMVQAGELGDVLSAKVSCDSRDTYTSVMRKLLRSIRIPVQRARKVGFQSETQLRFARLDQLVESEDMSPADVAQDVAAVDVEIVLVVDEFDRMVPAERARFADAIKVFSDSVANVTLVLVGVADNVDGLISDHKSVERAVAQIRLSRLDVQDSLEILTRRFARLGIEDPGDLGSTIAHLSQGLPHFVHLLGLGAVTSAFDQGRLSLEGEDLRMAVRSAIQGADQTIVSAYSRATRSPRVDALYTKVLAAAAMAEVDLEGYFAAPHVLPHMARLHPAAAKSIAFMKHLDEFSTAARGEVLDKIGAKRKWRYRFRNPMMKAYVLIQAVADGKVGVADVRYQPSRRVVDAYDSIGSRDDLPGR